MAYSKITLLAALAAIAYAQTQAQINELNVVLDDVKTNIADYITLSETPNSGFSLDQMPAGIMDIAAQLVANPSDDSYTTLYSEVDFSAVEHMLTMVPWYSSRPVSYTHLDVYKRQALHLDCSSFFAQPASIAGCSLNLQDHLLIKNQDLAIHPH